MRRFIAGLALILAYYFAGAASVLFYAGACCARFGERSLSR